MSTPDAVAAVDLLGGAFGRRDLAAALDCFVDGDDITYVGSEAGESANGRAAVTQLLGDLFTRPDSYSWTATTAVIHELPGGHTFILAEADGLENGTTPFGYRLTGVLAHTPDGPRWRAVLGAEPTT